MDPNDIINKLHYIISSNSPTAPLHFPNTTMPVHAPMTPIEEHHARHQQLVLINERKRRRMISNRESARRSRMRKQSQLDMLWSQVVWLRDENCRLSDGLARATEAGDQAARENAQLKGEVSILREMVSNMQLDTTFLSLSDLEDVSCNNAAATARVIAETSE